MFAHEPSKKVGYDVEKSDGPYEGASGDKERNPFLASATKKENIVRKNDIL
jgi:hypothetical protein